MKFYQIFLDQFIQYIPEKGVIVRSNSSNLACFTRMSGSSYSISYKVKNLQASSAFKSYPEISVDAVDKTSLQLLRNQTHIKISKALHVGCITIYQRDVEVETYLAMPDGDKIYRLYDWVWWT